MRDDMDLIDLPFDLYTRDIIIKKMIDGIRKEGEALKILDVGGRQGRLCSFLKNDEIHVLDIRMGNGLNYVLGNVKNAPYKDSSYDVVVSSDVYEHIPEKDRLKVLSEMFRISKSFVILGAPFYSEEVEDAEIRACNYYREIAGEPHPWLKEHIENGLPSKNELESFLRENKFSFSKTQTNNISNWFLLQLYIFYSYKFGIPAESISKVYRYYNENFKSLGDLTGPAYRTIYLMGKKGSLPDIDPEYASEIDLLKYRELESLIFESLGQLTDSKNTHISNLEAEIEARGKEIENREARISSLETDIENRGREVESRENRISSLETEIEARGREVESREKRISSLETEIEARGKEIENRENRISSLETEIEARGKEIENRENRISSLETDIENRGKEVESREDRISSLENLISDQNHELSSIHNSITWNILTKFQHLIDLIFPCNTKIRHIYDLGLLSLRLIANDGFKAFLYKAKERSNNQYFDSSRVPILETHIKPQSFPLSLSKPLSGNFESPVKGLNEIKILTATYKRTNSDLELQIISSDNEILRKTIVKGYQIKDNEHTSFKFKSIKDSRNFTFRLISRDEPAAAVWCNETQQSRKLSLIYAGEPLNGNIGFQVFVNAGIKSKYDLWILKNEATAAELGQYKKEIQNFEYKPKISIIVPVYNPDVTWIKAAIESVRDQVYDNWELCLADASTKQEVRDCLKNYPEMDGRIKVKFLTENKGISENSNEALAIATGDYIGLLDHDDMLSPDALYEVVKYLQNNRDTDMIYSDEDKIDLEDKRSDPFFKPNWSLDTFLACMYTCHFGVYNKKIIDEIEGFRKSYDGSQDYDLVLRFIEKTASIHHIPKILYHWRMVPNSAACSIDSKKYAYTAAKRALADYLKRNHLKGQIMDGFWTGSYRVNREISENSPVSIIIPTKDNADVLRKCIDSVLKFTKYINYEIIVVNNNSIDEATYDYFEKIKYTDNIKIIDYSKPFNFSAINNFAVSNANGEYILFLNDDTEVIAEGWLASLIKEAQRPEVGAVGCKLLYPDDTIQHSGIILGMGLHKVAGLSHRKFPGKDHGYFGRANIINNVSAVTAACMMMRKEVFEEAGGFDEKNLAVAFNDVDLCLKIREKGYRIVYTPYAELYHHESLSRGYEDSPEKQERFLREVEYMRQKWGEVIDRGDPYYNPNLTLEKEDFSMKL